MNGSPDINPVPAGFDATSQPNTQTQAEKQEGVQDPSKRSFLKAILGLVGLAAVGGAVTKIAGDRGVPEQSELEGQETGQSMVPPQPGVTPPANPNNKR